MALQSWKDFMHRWMKAYIMSYDAKAQLSVLDKTSKAASAILKVKFGVLSLQYPFFFLSLIYQLSEIPVQAYITSHIGCFVICFSSRV